VGKTAKISLFASLCQSESWPDFPFFLTSDTTDLPSGVLDSYTRAEASLPLTSSEPRQLHREQIRTSGTAHGLQPLGADSRHKRFACHRTAPNEYKRAAFRRVSNLPSGARLDHPINRLNHHEIISDHVQLLRLRGCLWNNRG
jgi:hypothetical protein